MISFWRRGFGADSSWDVYGVPSGDYRVTLGVGKPSSEANAWEMSCAMGSIFFFATPYTLGALDPFVVQELLDIHEAVFPNARHPSARDLLRGRGYGEYLRALGRELEQAARHGLVRVEKFTTPFPFIDIEKKAPSHPPALGPEEEDETTTLKIWLLDEFKQRMSEAPYQVKIGGDTRRGTANDQGLLVEKNVSLSGECTLEWGKPREGSSEAYLYMRTLKTSTSHDDALHNLGYQGKDKLAAFHADYSAEHNAMNVHDTGTAGTRNA